MKAKTSIFGRIVKCYNLPLDGIEDLNKKFGTLPSGKELPTVIRPVVTVPTTEQITENY